ncbi:YopX family protein [Streptococcus uberis]|uniref:YopX family protein n=1 Tax=Streptococcus uberis TaxID=1349 RepID=UPI003566FE16
MLKIRVFVKELSKMFLPEDIVYIDYSEKTVTVRGCQYSDCDTCHDEYSWEKCETMRCTDVLDNSEPRKEIFEGDIVKTTRFFGRADETGGFYEYDKELIGIVKQLEGAWVIDTGCDAVFLWTEIEENEVLGNIYETPDLIEVRHEQATT